MIVGSLICYSRPLAGSIGDCRDGLVQNEIYTIKKIESCGIITRIMLFEIPHVYYNSELFTATESPDHEASVIAIVCSAINRIDDFFEYANESLSDRQFVRAQLNAMNKQLTAHRDAKSN